MLNDRKLKILQAIIQDYIETAEPVGSRTLSKKYNLGISPATIRNEMADLEELGFIMQPHTSAGRVPSDKGYRLYVDQFLPLGNLDFLENEQIELELLKSVGEIEQLLEYSTKILSQLTNYTAVAIAPQVKESKLKHIQLLSIDPRNVLIILITDGGMVKKSLIRLDQEVEEGILQAVSNLLNEKFVGRTIKSIEKGLGDAFSLVFGDSSPIINKIIAELLQTLDEINDIDIFLNGATNIFNFPEYNDIFKAKSFLSLLEEKHLLSSMITSFNSEGLKISIGSENQHKEAQDCSLVTATYKIDNTTLGWLSIIGPTRMNYSTVVNVMNHVSHFINTILRDKFK